MTTKHALFLLRHADAGDPEAWTRADTERPLSPKGIAQAERLAAHLAGAGVEVGRLRTSPKARAIQTAKLVGGALGRTPVVEAWLGESFDLAAVADLLGPADAPDAPDVLVGHDPDLSDLLAALVGADLQLKKGALALVDWRGDLAEGAARLRWLLPPDAIGR